MKADYVTVTCIYVTQTRDALGIRSIEPGIESLKTIWAPKSLIHMGDLRYLERQQEEEEVSFRLMEWKAEELGL